MEKTNRIINKINQFLTKNQIIILFAFLTYSLLIFSTIVSDYCNSRYRQEVLVIFGFSMLFLVLFNESILKRKTKEAMDLSIILFVMGTLVMVASIRERDIIQTAGGWRYRFQFIELIAGCFFCAFRTWIYLFKNKIRVYEKSIIDIIKEYTFLIIVIVIAVFMAGIHAGAQERGDELIMYNGIQRFQIVDLFYLNALSSTHVDPFYVIYCGVWKFVFEDNAFGMNVASFSLYVISCFCVYGIIKKLFPQKKNYELTILTSIYIFSPFMLGLVITNSWDYFTMVLFPIVVYFEMERRYVLHFLSAIALVFCKEPMIVVYAGFCIGVLIRQIIQCVKDKKSVVKILSNPIYYVMLIIGISWIVIYEYTPKWGGLPSVLNIFSDSTETVHELSEGTGFARFQFPTLGYLIEKGKNYFVLHFNWILCIGAVTGLIGQIIKTQKEGLYSQIPLLSGETAFLILSCFLNAGNSVRYMDIHVSALSLLFIVAVAYINHRILCLGISGIVTILLMFSLYRVADPLTALTKNTENTGNTRVVGNVLIDKTNFQYKFMDELIDMAIEEPLKNGQLIIFPMVKDSRKSHLLFEGAHYFDEEGLETFFWDDDRKQRFTYAETGWGYIEEDWLSFSVYNMISSDNLREKLEGYHEAYYFCFPYIGMDLLDQLEDDGYVIQKEEIEYNGWIITRAHLVWE